MQPKSGAGISFVQLSHALSLLPDRNPKRVVGPLGCPVALRDRSGPDPSLNHRAKMGGRELAMMKAEGTAIGG